MLIAVLLGGCAGTGQLPERGQQAEEVVPFETAAGEASYHLLLAELALERDQFDGAADEYRRAAQLSDDPEIAQRAATLAFSLGRNKDALVSAQRWAALEPASVEARRYLASLYLRESDLDGAVNELTGLLEMLGDTAEDGFLSITSILLEEPDQVIASRAMDRLVARKPEVAAAHYGSALMAMQAGNYDKAQREVLRAEQLRPDWPRAGLLHARVLVARGEEDSGLEKAAELARNASDPSLRLDYALLLANLDREGEARLELDLLLQEHPRMAGALRAAGLLEMRRGDLDAAQMHFTSLLATGRGTWEAFFYLGTIAEQREQTARAIRYYSQVRDGDLAITAQARAAGLYEKLGDIDRAVDHLVNFSNAVPKYDAQLNIAAGELLARNKQMQRALEIYDAVLARHPGNRAARFARAFVYEDLDQVDLAIVELRALLKEQPDDATALNALGYTLADRTDRHREAYRLIRRAYDLEPGNPAIIDSLGWIEYKRGNNEAALEYLQKAYRLVRDPEIAAHIGEVLWVQGRTEEAVEIWQTSLEENPDDTSLLEVMQRFSQ